MQENNRTYETMISWDNIAIGLRESHKMTPQQRQAQFGNQRHVALTAAGGSNTIPMRQHPELGQAHLARLNYQSVQRAQAKQEVPARIHGDQDFFLHRTRSRILRSERWVWNNRLTLKHITCYQWHDASKLFSASSVALPFSHFFVKR